MKCLKGFEYRNGNKVEFDGAMGTVVLTYHKPTEPELDFVSDATPSPSPAIIEILDDGVKIVGWGHTYFTAAIFDAQGHAIALSKSEMAHEAVRSAYVELAAKLATEDAGLY